MTQYVFMNEEIRKAKPKRPVIVHQTWDGNQRESNAFAISLNGRHLGYVRFSPDMLDACETHEVKAWVEFEDEVSIKPCQVADLTPEQAAMLDEHPDNPARAHAKEPNKPVVIENPTMKIS